MKKFKLPVLPAVLAAVFYGVSTPVSKLLLAELPPVFLAALLYLGAGLGAVIIHLSGNKREPEQKEARITKKEMHISSA